MTTKLEGVKKTDRWEEDRKKGARPVSGRFVWRECPGGSFKFHFRGFPGDPVKTYELTDGQEYTLPVAVVKHLVNNCQVEETTNVIKQVDINGKPLYDKKMIPRFAFISNELYL